MCTRSLVRLGTTIMIAAQRTRAQASHWTWLRRRAPSDSGRRWRDRSASQILRCVPAPGSDGPSPGATGSAMNESHELGGEPSTPRRGFPRSFVRPRPRPLTAFAAGIAITVLGGAVIVAALPSPAPQLTERDVRATVQNALASQRPGPPFSALVYDVIMPSIVLIRSERPADPAGPTDAPSDEGVGTGVVVASGGEVLTAWHVVDGSS